jgi:amidase
MSAIVPLGFYPASVKARGVVPNVYNVAPGLPFGISFFGTAYSEYKLIKLAYAYEQQTQTRLARKAYSAAMPQTQLTDMLNSSYLQSQST